MVLSHWELNPVVVFRTWGLGWGHWIVPKEVTSPRALLESPSWAPPPFSACWFTMRPLLSDSLSMVGVDGGRLLYIPYHGFRLPSFLHNQFVPGTLL